MTEEAAETKMSLHDIPVLEGTDTYAAWKLAVVNKLRIDGIAGISDGSEVEPYRSVPTDAVEPSRLTRAGSAPPTASESTTEKELTAEQKKEWRVWQRKEVKVQGIVSSTISEGIAYDTDELPSAKALWNHIEKRHRLDTPEEQANIMAALAMLRLTADCDANSMEAHVESFNKLMMRAKAAGIRFSGEQRVFVDCIEDAQSRTYSAHSRMPPRPTSDPVAGMSQLLWLMPSREEVKGYFCREHCCLVTEQLPALSHNGYVSLFPIRGSRPASEHGPREKTGCPLGTSMDGITEFDPGRRLSFDDEKTACLRGMESSCVHASCVHAAF
jgi:hypothetical protein